MWYFRAYVFATHLDFRSRDESGSYLLSGMERGKLEEAMSKNNDSISFDEEREGGQTHASVIGDRKSSAAHLMVKPLKKRTKKSWGLNDKPKY